MKGCGEKWELKEARMSVEIEKKNTG